MLSAIWCATCIYISIQCADVQRGVSPMSMAFLNLCFQFTNPNARIWTYVLPARESSCCFCRLVHNCSIATTSFKDQNHTENLETTGKHFNDTAAIVRTPQMPTFPSYESSPNCTTRGTSVITYIERVHRLIGPCIYDLGSSRVPSIL
jgi:hypothetical protein